MFSIFKSTWQEKTISVVMQTALKEILPQYWELTENETIRLCNKMAKGMIRKNHDFYSGKFGAPPNRIVAAVLSFATALDEEYDEDLKIHFILVASSMVEDIGKFHEDVDLSPMDVEILTEVPRLSASYLARIEEGRQ